MHMSLKISICFLMLFFIFCGKINAQLCEGSLGDPVVDITFGSGSNPGPPLPSGTTDYTYVATGCPNDGQYTITNSITNCFGGTWYPAKDHTPGVPNGYMMAVNASYNPGDFYVTKVDGLCPNTTYQFAAWIFNLLTTYACNAQGIKPNITFNIETTSGTVLGTYSTGDIAEDLGWQQYGLFFTTTPGESSVVLRMTNNAPGGCGNDLLLDDITFRACGPLVTASINGSLDSVDVCTGDSSVFTIKADVSAGYSDPAYQWQVSTDSGASYTNLVGDTNKIFVRPATNIPATYLYRLAVSQRQNMGVSSCSIFSNVVVVGVNKYPVVDASATGHCTGDTLHLMANDGVSFSWNGPLGFSSNDQNPYIPAVGLGNNGTYYVSVTSAKGCVSKDSVTTSLFQKPTIDAGNDQEICAGSSVQLNSTGSNNITSYQWSPPEGLSNTAIPNPIASPVESTLYVVAVTNNDCEVSDSVLVTVNENPVANAGPDKIIIKGQSATLDGSAGGTDVTYLWTPDINISSTSTLAPIVNPDTNQVYTLNVYSNKGCKTATDSVQVKVYQQLYIPNAFTPNGDGINDTWDIETLQAYPGAEVKVFNRYGQIVFDNNGKNVSWDGTFKGEPQQAGAYVYLIDLKNNTPVIKGIVYIIL